MRETLERPVGFEPTTSGLEDQRSTSELRPLSEWALIDVCNRRQIPPLNAYYRHPKIATTLPRQWMVYRASSSTHCQAADYPAAETIPHFKPKRNRKISELSESSPLQLGEMAGEGR